jgi:hypothetical protein
MISALQKGGAEVFVITDIPEKVTAQALLGKYGYSIPP